MKKEMHNGIISFWKFMFCLLIIAFHTGSWHPELKNRFASGSIGVEFFFIISGFLFCKKYINDNTQLIGKSTFDFLVNRIKRFLIYIVIFVIITIPALLLMRKCSISDIIYSITILLYIPKHFEVDIMLSSIFGLTWYIISLIIIETLIYPLLIKFKEDFVYIISPIIILLIGNYLLIKYDSLSSPWAVDIFSYKGFLRGIIDINLGMYLFLISEKIKKFNFTNFSLFLITIIELFCYISVFYLSNRYSVNNKFELLMIFLLSIGILISFSKKSLLYNFCNNKLFYYLEAISLPMYLHQCLIINIVRFIIQKYSINISFYKELIIVIIISIILALITLKIVKIFSKNKEKIKKIFIE